MLVAFILLPLVCVLLLGWDWREIVLLYWLENVSLGVAMLITMARSARAPGGDDPSVVKGLTINGRRVAGPGSGLALAGFFAMHDRRFTLVHGIFVMVLISGVFFPGAAPDSPVNWWGALLVWLVGGAVQVVESGWGPAAAPLLIALHVAVDIGAWMLSAARDRLASRASATERPAASVAPSDPADQSPPQP